MPTSVPLSTFVRCLKLAREFDQEYSTFRQVQWMLDHWSFDNNEAHYPQRSANVVEVMKEVISEVNE